MVNRNKLKVATAPFWSCHTVNKVILASEINKVKVHVVMRAICETQNPCLKDGFNHLAPEFGI
jgi:hypothetical protein